MPGRCALAVMAALTLAGPAAAEPPTCAPLEQTEFRSLVLDAQAAIDRDDAALHATIVEEILERVPCLRFAPSPRLWSEFLVGVAIVEFASGGDWQTTLGAALRIRPTVDRGVGGGHPMATWEPPPTGADSSGPVPPGSPVFIDGSPAADLPPGEGLFLVQREEDGRWATLLLHDQAVPEDWLTSPIEVPQRVHAWSHLSFQAGVGALSQDPSWSSDYIPGATWTGFTPGVAARGLASYRGFGLLGEGAVGWTDLAQATGGTVQLALSTVVRSTAIGLGGGIIGVDVFEGGATLDEAASRSVLLPYLHLAVLTRFHAVWDWDLGASHGRGAAVRRSDLHVGARPPGAELPWRYGLCLSWFRSFFRRDSGFSIESVRASQWRLSLEIGWSFGS